MEVLITFRTQKKCLKLIIKPTWYFHLVSRSFGDMKLLVIKCSILTGVSLEQFGLLQFPLMLVDGEISSQLDGPFYIELKVFLLFYQLWWCIVYNLWAFYLSFELNIIRENSQFYIILPPTLLLHHINKHFHRPPLPLPHTPKYKTGYSSVTSNLVIKQLLLLIECKDLELNLSVTHRYSQKIIRY